MQVEAPDAQEPGPWTAPSFEAGFDRLVAMGLSPRQMDEVHHLVSDAVREMIAHASRHHPQELSGLLRYLFHLIIEPPSEPTPLMVSAAEPAAS